VPNHLLTAELGDLPEELAAHADAFRGRFMIVKKAEVFPVECIVRGYLAGSGWKEYREHGTVCGQKLPEGLVESSRLPEPIFTPSTKAESGHDVNITAAQAADIIGPELFERLRDLSLAVFARGASHAERLGIIVADTKFEFGLAGEAGDGERLLLIDEVLTPDSSRFWPADAYRPGGPQPSFDKQYVRDYLEAIGWNKQPPAPGLPADVVEKTREKYVEAYRRLTGRELTL